MNIQDVKERVRALLMKASDAAASPSEAEAAMRMAQKLMQRYQMTEADLGSLQSSDWREVNLSPLYSKTAGYYRHPVEKYLSRVVGDFCGVIAYKSGEDFTADVQTVLFGLDADVELAKWMLDAFKQQMERDWALYKRFQMESKRLKNVSEARKSFVRGFCSAVQERLKDWMFRDTPTADQSPDQGSGAALVIRKRNLAIDELAARGIHLATGTASSKGGAARDTAAAGAGYNSGNAAPMGGKQVGGARIAIGSR